MAELRNGTGFPLTDPSGLRYNVVNLTTKREVIQMLFLPREEGQGMVEYALILVLVSIVVIVILTVMGPAIGNIFSQIVAVL